MQQGGRRRIDRFAVLVSVTGLSALVWIAISGRVGHAGTSPAEFGLLVAFVVLGELLPLKLPRREEEEELTTSPTFSFALLITSGVAGAVLALALAELLAYFFRAKPLSKSTFNIAQNTLALIAASAVMTLITDVPRSGPPFFETADIPGILLSMVVFFLVSTTLTGTWFARRHDAAVLEHLRRDLLFRGGVGGASLA